MKDICTIKSSKYGVLLVLNDEVTYEELILGVCRTFAKRAEFFGERDLILSVEGRSMTGEEMSGMIEAIELNSKVKVTLVDWHDELYDSRMLDKKDRFYFDNVYQNAKIVPWTLKAKDEASSDSSIVILGDVKRGAKVSAAYNVIILGECQGEINAGAGGEENCFVCANNFDGAKVSIANHSDTFTTKKKGLFNRAKFPKEPVAVVMWEIGRAHV